MPTIWSIFIFSSCGNVKDFRVGISGIPAFRILRSITNSQARYKHLWGIFIALFGLEKVKKTNKMTASEAFISKTKKFWGCGSYFYKKEKDVELEISKVPKKNSLRSESIMLDDKCLCLCLKYQFVNISSYEYECLWPSHQNNRNTYLWRAC